MTKARSKLNWIVFDDILKEAVEVAYDAWPERKEYVWNNMSVYAIDGSRYMLPATDEIRREYDKNSGLQNKCNRHYPLCLVSTAYDVLRKIPVSRTVVGNHNGDEREEAKKLIERIPGGNVLLFDRGYPSYGFIRYLNLNYKGFYLFRCSSKYTFPSVEEFIDSNKEEDIIWINPSKKYLEKSTIPLDERKLSVPIKLRVIKIVSPDGTVSVLLTNLLNNRTFHIDEVEKLYFKRWPIEEHYRDEKTSLEIQRFHSKSVNGVLQELFAILIMTVISKTLMALSAVIVENRSVEPQFKFTIMALALDASFLSATNITKIIEVLTDLLDAMNKVKYYRPKKLRPSQPRVSKTPVNIWRDAKIVKLTQS